VAWDGMMRSQVSKARLRPTDEDLSMGPKPGAPGGPSGRLGDPRRAFWRARSPRSRASRCPRCAQPARQVEAVSARLKACLDARRPPPAFSTGLIANSSLDLDPASGPTIVGER
jgi:hypothetical protein